MADVEIVIRERLSIAQGAPGAFLDALRRACTYPNPAYKKAVALGLWNQPPREVSTARLEGGRLTLPRGATAKAREAAARTGARIIWRDERTRAPAEFPSFEVAEAQRQQRGIDLTDRQRSAIDAVVARENCYVQAATGWGKSAAIVEAVRRAGQRCLFLVPDNGILDQTIAASAVALGEGSAVRLTSKPMRLALVNVSTYAMAWSIVKARGDWAADLRESIGTVVCDELQFASSRSVNAVVEHFPARYRIGISATPDRKDGMEFVMHDTFGQRADHITVGDAIEEHRILPARLVLVQTGIRDPDYEEVAFGKGAARDPRVRRELYAMADEALRVSPERNRRIAADVAREHAAGHYCLVLCRRIEHCQAVLAALAERGVPTVLLRGGDRGAFADAVDQLRRGQVRAAVGSPKAFQGLDVPRLDRGFIATPMATNAPLIEQALGRFRRVADGKEDAIVFYYLDQHFFPGHAKKLRQLYGDLVEVAS